MAEAVDLLEETRDEVARALRHYEVVAPWLVDRFLVEAEAALDRISESPASGGPWHHRGIAREMRRMPLRTFPYAFFYVTSPRLVAFAFAHARRRPGYFVERLGRV